MAHGSIDGRTNLDIKRLALKDRKIFQGKVLDITTCLITIRYGRVGGKTTVIIEKFSFQR